MEHGESSQSKVSDGVPFASFSTNTGAEDATEVLVGENAVVIKLPGPVHVENSDNFSRAIGTCQGCPAHHGGS